MAPIRFRLLGPVQLVHGDEPVPIGGPGVRGLLALLALKPGKVVGLDEIIDALWGHDPPATVRTIIHGNVSHLRRILREIDGPSILTTPPGYRLDVDPDQVDVHRAHALLDRASVATPEVAAALLAEALTLWQGPALGGVPDSLRAPELEDLRLAVHGARVDADLELGRHAELIVELSPIVRADPLAERTAGQLMRALYHAGRRGDALELYRTVSRATLGTLGVEPGAELRWLHERVLNDDLPPLSRESSHQGASLSRESDAAAKPISQLPAAVPSLAGRAEELAWLDGLVTRAEAGETTIAVVTGTAGVGKSTLVVWWAHRVASRFPDGVLFASLRGFDPHHPPLEPAELLTQFLLGLGVETAKVPELLHERVALYRSLIAGRRMLVLLDDARTAEQVRPLLPPSARTMTVVTSRSRLDGLTVSNAAKQRVLGTLAPDDAVRLIEELAGPADLNHALARLCGYLPLALRIAGARLSASALRTAEEMVDELGNERTRLAGLQVEGAEDGVRAAFDVSFRGLPGEIAETFLQLGAVPGVLVGPHVMAAVAQIPVTEARRRLRALAAHNLIAETARDVFVPHDLVWLYLRELAEQELGEKERDEALGWTVRYYQAVADRARRRLGPVADPLDFTGVLADDAMPPLRGFTEAHDWFAAEWPNLLAVLDAAFAAGRLDDVWRLARLGHSYRLACPLLDEWTRMADLGVAAAEAAGDVAGQCWLRLARSEIALAFELPGFGHADAERAAELATGLGDERLTTSADLHLGRALSRLGEHERAIERLGKAVAEAGDVTLRGQALSSCAQAEKRAGLLAEAIAHQLAGLRIDRELGDDDRVVVSLDKLADLSLRAGDLEAAERYVWEAIDLAISREFVAREGALRLTLGRVLRARGDIDGAREQLALSVRIYERVHPKLVGEVRAELAELQ
ncbi:DNA-binding SARP family transcriptional activator/tetratricopeptide (TPR) repeat protein [Amycolatopsis lexingtonensis]|uniref:DNA-binding SARP family transcriptional activator/tetratricopeptide (TPR) repeat protein n=1 Tax=Amycolatopsis lexingtonensis TaxID=218822 RepID=A0ABR9IBA7_9PSEU|nr:BTAD domain-containing putative transcriptional regulator [Amycolatopsis lexingtonensis]MBE1500465.1 DNA-binding SARP family transcriptional activator/tetratricopeptide (TPR) repeat protein [Amycolatopsis lexingtonensis]